MKRIAAAVALLFAFSAAGLPAYAADKDAKNPKKKKKDAEAAPVAGDTSLVGDLCIKPKGSGDGVVCGLISKSKGKEEILKLTAEGDLAKEIAEMRSKGMRVKVTGAVKEDTVAVHKIEAAARK